jgi:hypothetical protein
MMTSGKGMVRSLLRIGFVMCMFFAEVGANVSFAQEISVAPLTSDQIVQRMVERNEQRAQALESYRGTRIYNLEYRGLASKSATLVVTMTYRRPDEKKFCIVSESGSELLQGRVLKRLLEVEIEAMQDEQRRQTAMNPKDFAVARMEGEPAKNPSWWTKRNAIRVTYEKIGDFWLPTRNETNTQLRIIGSSLLTIVYRDYEITEAGATQVTATSGNIVGCPGEPEKLSQVQP